jgi:hypothetical protein
VVGKFKKFEKLVMTTFNALPLMTRAMKKIASLIEREFDYIIDMFSHKYRYEALTQQHCWALQIMRFLSGIIQDILSHDETAHRQRSSEICENQRVIVTKEAIVKVIRQITCSETSLQVTPSPGFYHRYGI